MEPLVQAGAASGNRLGKALIYADCLRIQSLQVPQQENEGTQGRSIAAGKRIAQRIWLDYTGQIGFCALFS